MCQYRPEQREREREREIGEKMGEVEMMVEREPTEKAEVVKDKAAEK